MSQRARSIQTFLGVNYRRLAKAGANSEVSILVLSRYLTVKPGGPILGVVLVYTKVLPD